MARLFAPAEPTHSIRAIVAGQSPGVSFGSAAGPHSPDARETIWLSTVEGRDTRPCDSRCLTDCRPKCRTLMGVPSCCYRVCDCYDDGLLFGRTVGGLRLGS